MLQLKGCVVTMDALHCRRDTAQAIVERGGDYVLAVKDNQPGLLRDAKWVGGVGGLLPWGYPTEPPGGRGWRNVCVGLDAIKKRGYLGWLRIADCGRSHRAIGVRPGKPRIGSAKVSHERARPGGVGLRCGSSMRGGRGRWAIISQNPRALCRPVTPR